YVWPRGRPLFYGDRRGAVRILPPVRPPAPPAGADEPRHRPGAVGCHRALPGPRPGEALRLHAGAGGVAVRRGAARRETRSPIPDPRSPLLPRAGAASWGWALRGGATAGRERPHLAKPAQPRGPYQLAQYQHRERGGAAGI